MAVLPQACAIQREAILGVIQQRNALLDAVFYDVGRITAQETPALAFWQAGEGSLLIVPPTGQGGLSIYQDKESFFQNGGLSVKALAVAGVGSSALGAAAFARNIADALGAPAAAVVSGYGLSDALTEALGGFYWFGMLNGLRHQLEALDDFINLRVPPRSAERSSWLRLSRDTAVLIDLLADKRFKCPLLVGHSKGNLVISEALYALEQSNILKPVARRCKIVTISAKIGMPSAFKGKVLDIIGQWDGFGALNSRPDIPADVIVPRTWHSTNPDFPFGMGIDVTKILQESLPLLDRPRHHIRRPFLSPLLDAQQRAAGRIATHKPISINGQKSA